MKINNIFLRAFLGLLFAFSGVYASAQGTSHRDFQPYLQLISTSDQGGHTSFVYRLEGDQNEISKNIQWLETMNHDKLVYSSVVVDRASQTCTVTMAGISDSQRAAVVQSDLNARLHVLNKVPASAEEQSLQTQHTLNAPAASQVAPVQNGPGSPAEKALQQQYENNVSNNNLNR